MSRGRSSCSAPQGSVFSCGFPASPPQARAAALWGHLVVRMAPLVWVLVSGFRETAPLHWAAIRAKYFNCQRASWDVKREVKIGGGS